jgi:hypothetical protein
MSTNLQQRAVSYLELKKLQRKLAVAGDLRNARDLGQKIDKHGIRIASEFLGVKELPDSLNGTLVREIAVESASLVQDGSAVKAKLRSVLRRAAWSTDADITRKLEKAKSLVPNIRKMLTVLR